MNAIELIYIALLAFIVFHIVLMATHIPKIKAIDKKNNKRRRRATTPPRKKRRSI